MMLNIKSASLTRVLNGVNTCSTSRTMKQQIIRLWQMNKKMSTTMSEPHDEESIER